MELEDEIKLEMSGVTQVTSTSKCRLVCVKRTYFPWGMCASYKIIGEKKPWYKYLYQRLRIFYKKLGNIF